jgi:hypothetical protein
MTDGLTLSTNHTLHPINRPLLRWREESEMENTLTLSITDVLGNTLPVLNFYGDGSYDCPHCHYPIRADEGLGPCKNPWCIANPQMPVDAANKIPADRERKRMEEERRKHDHEMAMQRIQEWNETRDRERTTKLLAAKEQGYCLTCLIRSNYRKEVKHRKSCPHTH